MNECKLSVEFASNFRNVDLARAALKGIITEYFGERKESADDMLMATNEAMNNAVEHSASLSIILEVACYESEIGVFVISGGAPFDPVAAAAELDEEDMLEREEGGYGLFLIRELVDRFEYEYKQQHNIWKLFKK